MDDQRRIVMMAGAAALAAGAAAIRMMENRPENPERRRPYRPTAPIPDVQFDLNELDEDTVTELFRFERRHIQRLIHLFDLGQAVYLARVAPSPETALCVVLYRLGRPRTYYDMTQIFGKSRSWLSQVFNAVIEHLGRKYQGLLQWDERRLTLAKMEEYTLAVHQQGGPSRVGGFVDGTMRPIARPGLNQGQYYSGHKRKHGLKWQGIVTPDGLISGLYGPAIGKTGDWKMWIDSGVSQRLRAVKGHLGAAERPVLYGDKAYVQGGFGLIGAFSANASQPLSQSQDSFNKSMTYFRLSVEHAFGKASNLWQQVEFPRGNSVGISPVAGIYMVAVLLTHCHTCLYGSQTSQFFDCTPPSLNEYLGTVNGVEI